MTLLYLSGEEKAGFVRMFAVVVVVVVVVVIGHTKHPKPRLLKPKLLEPKLVDQ
jgi:hypothetical protein